MTGSLAGTPIHRVEEHGGGEGEAEEADNLHLGTQISVAEADTVFILTSVAVTCG